MGKEGKWADHTENELPELSPCLPYKYDVIAYQNASPASSSFAHFAWLFTVSLQSLREGPHNKGQSERPGPTQQAERVGSSTAVFAPNRTKP